MIGKTGRTGGMRVEEDVRTGPAAPTSLLRGTAPVPATEEKTMKYMIMMYGSQQDYDMLTGKSTPDRPAWSGEDLARMGAFMEAWNKDLAESGEFVDARGLTAPVHARRIQLRNGVPVVTDGPYAETQEVLAGYTIVECASFDRATEIAARLADTPHPEDAKLSHEWYVDVRPIVDSRAELDL
jgi:hypothetical protein